MAVGDQFSPHQRLAPASTSMQAHRLSQATTLASNGSSISLGDGRHPGRPWSPHGWHRPWSGSPDAILPSEASHSRRPSWSLGGHGPHPDFTGYAVAESTTDLRPEHASPRFATNIWGVPERRAAGADGRLAPLRVVTTEVSGIHESSAPDSEETTPRPRNDHDPLEGPSTLSSAGRT